MLHPVAQEPYMPTSQFVIDWAAVGRPTCSLGVDGYTMWLLSCSVLPSIAREHVGRMLAVPSPLCVRDIVCRAGQVLPHNIPDMEGHGHCCGCSAAVCSRYLPPCSVPTSVKNAVVGPETRVLLVDRPTYHKVEDEMRSIKLNDGTVGNANGNCGGRPG